MKTSFLKLVTFVFYLTIQLFTLNCLYDPNQPLDEFIENEFINDEEVEEIDVQDDEEAVKSDENGEEDSNNENSNSESSEETNNKIEAHSDNAQPVEINSQIIDNSVKIIETNSKDNVANQIVGTKEDIILRSDNKINDFEEEKIDAIPSQINNEEKENSEDLIARNILLDSLNSDDNSDERNLVGTSRRKTVPMRTTNTKPNKTPSLGSKIGRPAHTSNNSSNSSTGIAELLGSVGSSGSSSDSSGGMDAEGLVSEALSSISSPCIPGVECEYDRVHIGSVDFIYQGTNEYEYEYEDYRNTDVTITYKENPGSDVITRFTLKIMEGVNVLRSMEYEILQLETRTESANPENRNRRINLSTILYDPDNNLSASEIAYLEPGGMYATSTHVLVISTCYNVSTYDSNSWCRDGIYRDEIIIIINPYNS